MTVLILLTGIVRLLILLSAIHNKTNTSADKDLYWGCRVQCPATSSPQYWAPAPAGPALLHLLRQAGKCSQSKAHHEPTKALGISSHHNPQNLTRKSLRRSTERSVLMHFSSSSPKTAHLSLEARRSCCVTKVWSLLVDNGGFKVLLLLALHQWEDQLSIAPCALCGLITVGRAATAKR